MVMTGRSQDPTTEQTPLTLTVMQTAKLLQISRNLAYEAVRTGQIPSIKVSKRILVPRVQLMKLLGEGTAASPKCDGTTGKA